MDYLEIAKAKLEASGMIGKRAPDVEAELKQIFSQAHDRIEEKWIPGLYDRLDRENPQFMAKIDTARNALDEIWLKVRSGDADIPEFKKGVQEWESLHLKVLTGG